MERNYKLVHELHLIVEDMSDAMLRANAGYVAGRRMTPHMEMALENYYEWAKRAKRAGL